MGKNPSIEPGLDYGIKDGLITGSIDVLRHQHLIFWSIEACLWLTAYASVTDNLGEVQNTGIEML
jgi:hypothetical protein